MSNSTRNLFLLYDFIQNGDSESVQRLVGRCGPDINTLLPGRGVGVLHLAVGVEPETASLRCTEILLKHGADPNLCSEDGTTPVHVAAVWGRLAALRLLVACGGDPARRDDDCRSAYDYAARERQWHVLRYLARTFHDVYDVAPTRHTAADVAGGAEDSDSSQCSYKLQLDRVLVSTGHVVAEYGPVSEERLKDVPSCRKSEMVREWCEKTTLVVNRLYPTILNQTYFLKDESVPWRPGDFTGNTSLANTTDVTLNDDGNKSSEVKSPNETKTSYKSCFSKKLSPDELSISGIKVLQETISEEDPNCNCSCHEGHTKPDVCSRRISMYENFSLPGSPKNITHQNYKTKTSLRKSKSKRSNSTKSDSQNGSTSEEVTSKSVVGHSDILTLDATEQVAGNTDEFYYVDYRSLNDALAIVQNETNEWLSQSSGSNDSDEHPTTDVIELNDSEPVVVVEDDDGTRRTSQRSSGVHSSGSSSSIAIASVQEEYKYEDKEEDVVLIEKRLIIPSVVLPVGEEPADGGSPEASRQSMASSLPASLEYDAARLRTELLACGFRPGPITAATSRLYLRKLKTLRSSPVVVATPQGRTYSVELERSLRSAEWLRELSPYAQLEAAARSGFAAGGSWREGNTKTSFTYLLLDPRTTDNLPVRAAAQDTHATWTTFVNSVFYVGKGKRSRPYSHLYQALTLWKRDFRTSKDKKVQHILDIWSDQVGVVCLHVFQNVIPAEAYTYEAAMIDVLGLSNLKNLKSGNYYGVAESWPARERRMLGLYLLYKAMLIFLSEGERQLRPGDID